MSISRPLSLVEIKNKFIQVIMSTDVKNLKQLVANTTEYIKGLKEELKVLETKEKDLIVLSEFHSDSDPSIHSGDEEDDYDYDDGFIDNELIDEEVEEIESELLNRRMKRKYPENDYTVQFIDDDGNVLDVEEEPVHKKKKLPEPNVGPTPEQIKKKSVVLLSDDPATTDDEEKKKKKKKERKPPSTDEMIEKKRKSEKKAKVLQNTTTGTENVVKAKEEPVKVIEEPKKEEEVITSSLPLEMIEEAKKLWEEITEKDLVERKVIETGESCDVVDVKGKYFVASKRGKLYYQIHKGIYEQFQGLRHKVDK